MFKLKLRRYTVIKSYFWTLIGVGGGCEDLVRSSVTKEISLFGSFVRHGGPCALSAPCR